MVAGAVVAAGAEVVADSGRSVLRGRLAERLWLSAFAMDSAPEARSVRNPGESPVGAVPLAPDQFKPWVSTLMARFASVVRTVTATLFFPAGWVAMSAWSPIPRTGAGAPLVGVDSVVVDVAVCASMVGVVNSQSWILAVRRHTSNTRRPRPR